MGVNTLYDKRQVAAGPSRDEMSTEAVGCREDEQYQALPLI